MTIKQSQNPGFAKALKQYYGIYDTVNDKEQGNKPKVVFDAVSLALAKLKT
jgi:hypothetical protein